MPTLSINGHNVQVDDSFLKLTPDQQNATVDEIAKSLGGDAQAQPQESTFADVLKSAAGGLAAGTADTLVLPERLAELGKKGIDYVAERFLPQSAADAYSNVVGTKADQRIASLRSNSDLPVIPSATQAADAVAGSVHQPETKAGQYAKTIGEFAPAALAGPGGIVRRAVTQAVVPAVASETAGQVYKGTPYEPYARIAGGIAGGLAPGAFSRAITPFPASAERTAAANVLRNEGVDLTAGQATGNNGLRYFESEVAPLADTMERQGEQFTKAALSRAGVNADRASPEVIDDAFHRIGGEFDALAARNHLVPDQAFVGDLANTVRNYTNLVPESARAPIVENTINDIMQNAQNGMTGQAYQALRSRLDRAARSARRDPQLSDALFGIRNALDGAMERSIAANNPADLGAWQQARNQYRNMLVLEKAATGAGENAAMGIISPSALRNATVQQGRRAYARGQGDFADLARAGEAVMKPLPQSGTAPRLNARNLGVGLGAIVGGSLGHAVGGYEGGAAGTLAGMTLPHVIGRGAATKPVQAYLANQLLAKMASMSPQRRAVLAALLASQGPLRALTSQ